MTTAPVGVERRAGQRFAFNLPVSLREVTTAVEGLGFTQDISSRGVFLFTGMALSAGAEIELTLKMPSEITLGESMRVRCRGRVLRVECASESRPTGESEADPGESKIGVAVCLKGYEYLPDSADESADFRRIAALQNSGVSQPTVRSVTGPRVTN
jgi:hypothetical protein